MGSSQWLIGGSATFYSNWTVDCGTSNITATAAGILTSAGKTLYDITTSAGVLTNSGTLTCHTLGSTGTGGFSMGAAAANVSSTVNFTGSGAHTLNSTFTQTGDANFTIASTVGTFTGGGSLDLKGSGTVTINKAISTTYLLNITVAYPGKTVTYNGLMATSVLNGTFTINGGNLTCNGISTQCDSSTPFVFVAGYTLTLGGAAYIYIRNGTATTVNLPAWTSTGGSGLIIGKYADTDVTWNMTGNINIGSATLYLYNHVTSNAYTFNTGLNPYYNITCGTLYIGNDVAGTSIINLNSSTITCTGYSGNTYNSGTTNVNYGSSQWAVGNGSFIEGSNHTVDSGTSLITFTNSASLVSAGKSLYDIKIDTPTKILTNSGALACHNLSITQGGFIQGTTAITCSGNFYYPGASNGTLDSTFTMTGLNKTWSLTSAGTVTTTSLVLTLQNNTTVVV
jgi:hypothetical protein